MFPSPGPSRPTITITVGVILAGLAALSLSGCSPISSPSGSDASGGGEPVKLRAASYTGPKSADTLASQEWAKLVEEYTDGEVTVEFFLSESLLPAGELLAGVGDRVADIGVLSHGYSPQQLPLTQVMNMAYVSDNVAAIGASLRELYETNETFSEQWAATNVRPLMFYALPPAVVGCKEPASTVEDFENRRVRTTSIITEDFRSIGAQTVTIPAPEIYESLERGVVDCWSGINLDLSGDLGLSGTPYIYDYGRGSNGGIELVINQEVWSGLSESQREAMDRASAEVINGAYLDIVRERLDAVCASIKTGPNSFEILPKKVQDEWAAKAIPASDAAFSAIAGTDGPAVLAEYQKLLEKNEKTYADSAKPMKDCV